MMINPHTFYLFLATATVLVLTPGPDTVLILSRTIATGARAGLFTLIGTQAGNVIHALLAGLGVSSLVLLFPMAFDVLKYLGAAYLIYLAVSAWRAPAKLTLDEHLADRRGTAARYFTQGLTNNLVNPKMIPFFIALFPQFVRPENGSVALQSLALGLTLGVIAVIWISVLVMLVARFRAAVVSNDTILKVANRLAAVTFFGLACRLVAQEQ